MPATSIADWTTYLSVVAGTAANLTGLVFVAVSINLSRILSVPGLTARAAESLMQLFGVVIIALTALTPGQEFVMLGARVLVLGSVLWLAQGVIQLRFARRKTHRSRSRVAARILLTQCSSLPLCVAGVFLLQGSLAGLNWLAAGCIFSLIAGVIGAWVLLVEILR